ncbi:homeobox protein cut-like 1 isoform X3 [Mya arenaria]|uniref:homeobox protein cut-like 1 isoform X3 n=1 Tax=Mya arenaria TaxID=6604 RepID=UPI0022E0B50E|nr:homeobox protein cut-like 1 isoform X3 [Mya arenaria]
MAASVQSMLDFWKQFDLQELQKDLDTTATELASRQDESDTSRKRLVELSREFKRTTPEDIRKIVAPLLKSFQGEIDALSKRSKAAEASFLSVYKKLIDLPDPVPVLEYGLQLQKKAHRVQDLEIENKQLRETLDEYNHEFAEVKNQEVTIKQLRDRLKEGEDRIEAVAEARTKEKERELQKLFAEKERQLQETQITVSKKLGEAEQRVAALTNTLENVQSELFEVKAKYDEATSAKHDETEMIMADLERANERATAAEREAEKLKHQLTSLSEGLTEGRSRQGPHGGDMEQAIEILQRSNLEAELAAKEKEISQLVEDVQKLQASLQKLRENTSQQVGRLEEELSAKNKAFSILEDRLKTQEDYEEIKRELSVLRSVEFSGSGADEVDGDVGKSKSLEVLVLEKNKALQTENTQLKHTSKDISGNTSPALSSHTKDFASMLGEEIAESYQERKSPKELLKNGHSTSVSPTFVAPKKEREQKSPSSVDSGDIPPQVPISPDVSKSLLYPSITSDALRIPPPSPHFFHPAFTNSHLMANFMGMGMNFNNNNNSQKSDLNGCQGLDTGLVAKTVRELLSIHNIGQRLFAKHVLGLSQGTVSELLSKPKSWDKLTEKGRESYRKMHSWAIDDRNIMALKAISPKKGNQPLLPSIQREDAATEERIAHILNEAQVAMQQKKSIEQHSMVNSIYQEMARSYGQLPTSHGLPINSMAAMHHAEQVRKMSDSDRRDKVGDNEVSSKVMVERIYRQELMKLAQAAENAGNIAASALYQQELARLAQNARMRDEPEPGEVRHMRGSPDRVSVKTEAQEGAEDLTNMSNGPIDLSKRSTSTPSTPTSGGSDKSLNSSAHAGSAFFQMHQKMNGHDVGERVIKSEPSQVPHAAFPHFPPSDTSSSPLQRMQNIANSLMNRSQMGQPCNKPLKAILPPITQEEFDSYANINTEDLVKQVKETLSQYSISQRLFGESVLGLSQGSVSDLLARPKPWHMLTQKGREPFIRMQLFLEDAEAIPKLVASQYHIAPDKLMRSNSFNKEQDLDHMPIWQGMRGPFPLAGLPLVSQSLNLGLSANRRRRHSLEEKFDSPSLALPKRPRVFFSEEQKDKLRQAYNRDPYPNQTTIEVLACNLGVGVKTVINWFHNHRMRAKQQQHATSPTGQYSDYSQSGMGKEESNDDNSNQSDISAYSDNKEALAALGFHSRFINPDTNQWMFPKFEPVNLDAKRGSQGSDNMDGSDGYEEEMDDEDSYAKDNSQNAKDDYDDVMDIDKDDQNSDDSHTERSERDEESGKGQVNSNSATMGSGANKRKRSHPQYVSAGRHLDRTVSMLAASAENNKDNETEKGSGENLEVKGDSFTEEKNEVEAAVNSLKEMKDSQLGESDGVDNDKLQERGSDPTGEDWAF